MTAALSKNFRFQAQKMPLIFAFYSVVAVVKTSYWLSQSSNPPEYSTAGEMKSPPLCSEKVSCEPWLVAICA